MKAAVISEHGSYDKIFFQERPLPIPVRSHAELLYRVRIKACGLNHLDTWVRRGVPGHKFPLPMVPGSDITGVIDEVFAPQNHAPSFQKNDAIIVNPGVFCGKCSPCLAGEDHLCQKWGLLGESEDGGCQEYILVPEHRIFKLPKNLSFEEGATLPIAYVTAWEMLVRKANLRKDQTVLIHGAGSGVSLACVQIAKLFKAQVILTSPSQEKLSLASSLGVDHSIDTSSQKIPDAVKLITQKQGVDIVVDHTGVVTFNDSLKCLKKGGKLVSCGATTGSQVSFDWKLVFFKNLMLLGSTYGPTSVFEEVLEHFEKKHLKPMPHEVFPLEELAKAHEKIENRSTFGKIVVQP